MPIEESVHEKHQQEIKWLAEILDNHPKALYEKEHKIYESPDAKPIFYTKHMFSVEKDIINNPNINDKIKQQIQDLNHRSLINPATSIVMNLNAAITSPDMQEKELPLTRKVQSFLSEKNITSYVIPAENNSSSPIIVIDLAQNKLTNKLQNIYESDIIPELTKKEATIIDPDGKERTPKHVVEKQIHAQLEEIVQRAKKIGIGSTSIQELLRSAIKKSQGQEQNL